MRIMGGHHPCNVGCGGSSSLPLSWLYLPVNAVAGCLNNNMVDEDDNEKEGKDQMAVAADDIVNHHHHHHPPSEGGFDN